MTAVADLGGSGNRTTSTDNRPAEFSKENLEDVH